MGSVTVSVRLHTTGSDLACRDTVLQEPVSAAQLRPSPQRPAGAPPDAADQPPRALHQRRGAQQERQLQRGRRRVTPGAAAAAAAPGREPPREGCGQ